MYTIEQLRKDLDALPSRLLDPRFLKGESLGNEVPFWIFHYPADCELFVRAHFQSLEKALSSKNVLHLNIFEVLIEMLKRRKLLNRIEMQERRVGHLKIKELLSVPLSQSRIAEHIQKSYDLEAQDLVIISGLGVAWPLLRGHELLSALQNIMKATPLVLFYPGNYDGYSLSPFGRVDSSNYYRAFTLNSSD